MNNHPASTSTNAAVDGDQTERRLEDASHNEASAAGSLTFSQHIVLWFAVRLGVHNPRDGALWLKCLFLHPRHGTLIPVDSKAVPDPLRAFARRLGVRNPRSARDWLIAAFLIPSSQRERLPARYSLSHFSRTWSGMAIRICRPIGWACGRLFAMIHALVRVTTQKIGERLPSVDYEGISTTLDGMASAPLLSYPVVRAAAIVGVAALFLLVVTTPFTLWGQFLFLVVMWAVAMFVRRIPGNMPTLLLIGLSLIASVRYAWWRITATLELETAWETFLATGLLLAEVYTWLILVLGYVQTAWPLKRKPVPLPADQAQWPTVDIFIPTYNEPLSVVKPTVLAAKLIDWPSDKIRIFILDDGRRPSFRAFAEEAGVEYMIRPDNYHAKAGNLNHALKKTSGEYIVIFDCDHLPTNAFLQAGMGWFLRDPKCAMLQTPHHFFSPDPFERNLSTFRRIPNEGALFYGLIQDANDLWNATFFCGSCAIIRRGPLEEIGGIAVETVTEDAHTALKLHRRGYTTAYINIPLAAGLATESLSGHVGQRIRWARGMAQIFRIDNPFLGKGLSFFQRICYGNAMLHFFYGIPRLVFLTAPLAYLYFEMHLINAAAGMIAMYALPHIIQSNLANAHVQGAHRHSFWAEVYETVLAWYIAMPTTIAMLNPSAGSFNVTAKGGLIEKTYFDWTISKPYLFLITINLGGLILGVFRMLYWNTGELTTVLLNMVWTFYNFLMLGVAIGVATETKQVRSAHRVTARLPAVARLDNGLSIACHTQDYSLSGLGLELHLEQQLPPGTPVEVSLWNGDTEHAFPTRVIVQKNGSLGVRFDGLSMQQEAELVQCTFARADAWTGWKDEQHIDRPLQGLKEIFSLGVVGYRKIFRTLKENMQAASNGARLPFARKASE